MNIQFRIFDQEGNIQPQPIWWQLPEADRESIIHLFANFLVDCAESNCDETEYSDDVSFKDFTGPRVA